MFTAVTTVVTTVVSDYIISIYMISLIPGIFWYIIRIIWYHLYFLKIQEYNKLYNFLKNIDWKILGRRDEILLVIFLKNLGTVTNSYFFKIIATFEQLAGFSPEHNLLTIFFEKFRSNYSLVFFENLGTQLACIF